MSTYYCLNIYVLVRSRRLNDYKKEEKVITECHHLCESIRFLWRAGPRGGGAESGFSLPGLLEIMLWQWQPWVKTTVCLSFYPFSIFIYVTLFHSLRLKEKCILYSYKPNIMQQYVICTTSNYQINYVHSVQKRSPSGSLRLLQHKENERFELERQHVFLIER